MGLNIEPQKQQILTNYLHTILKPVLYIFVGYPSQHSGNTNFKTCYWMRRALAQLLNRSYPNAKRSSGVRDALSPNQSKSSMIDFSALPVAQSDTPRFKQCMEHHFIIWTLKQGRPVNGPRTLVRKRMEITRMSLLKNAYRVKQKLVQTKSEIKWLRGPGFRHSARKLAVVCLKPSDLSCFDGGNMDEETIAQHWWQTRLQL